MVQSLVEVGGTLSTHPGRAGKVEELGGENLPAFGGVDHQSLACLDSARGNPGWRADDP